MKKIYMLLIASIVCYKSNAQSSYGTTVGKTYYDLPSNASSPNRIVYNEDDQSLSITWIQSITELAQPSFERGAGYNHYTPGIGWIYGEEGACRRNNGCTGEYSGWPEVVNFPQNYNSHMPRYDGNSYDTSISKEIIITHNGGLKRTLRYFRGVGDWRTTKKLLFDQSLCGQGYEGSFARAVNNDKYLHMIAVNQRPGIDTLNNNCLPYTALKKPLFYSRSSDQGDTWDIQNFVLPGLEDTNLLNIIYSDAYAIAVNKNVVAITAGTRSQPWVMWKSLDNGTTWEMTIIKDWDVNDIDLLNFQNKGVDKKYGPDGSHSLVIDDIGNVHCFVGRLLFNMDSLSSSNTDSTYNSGLWYWSDKFGEFCKPVVIADLIDYLDSNSTVHNTPIHSNENNWNPYDGMAKKIANANYLVGNTSMSNASVDENGNIYVVYSSVVEGTSTETSLSEGMPFRDIYLVWSNDNGQTWSKEINLGEFLGQDVFGDIAFEEDIYPMVAHKIGDDNKLHILWNMDYKPGSDVIYDNGEFSQQYQSYLGLDISTLPFEAKTSYSSTQTKSNISFSDTSFLIGDTALITCDTGYIEFTPYMSFIENSIDINLNSDSVSIIIDSVSKLYTFELKATNTCINSKKEIYFNVENGLLQAFIENNSVKVCKGDSLKLVGYGSGSTSYNYLWSTGDTTNFIKTLIINDTFFTLSVGGIDDTVFISLFPNPFANAGGEFDFICQNINYYTDTSSHFIELGSDSISGFTYKWTPKISMNYSSYLEATPMIYHPNDTIDYILKVTNQFGCSAYDTTTINYIPCGIDEKLDEIAVTLFPNPTTQNITISAKERIDNYSLINNFGQVIISKTVNQLNFDVDLQNLPKGMYFIQLQIGKQLQTEKVILL